MAERKPKKRKPWKRKKRWWKEKGKGYEIPPPRIKLLKVWKEFNRNIHKVLSMIVDGTNAILGRLASSVVKELKKGETIEIINAEKILITGDPHSILKEYNERRARGSKEHGPFFPKKADLIVKRTIRGMLPYKQEKGRILFKKVRVYTGVPKAFQNKEAKSLGKKEITCPFITVGELSRLIGG